MANVIPGETIGSLATKKREELLGMIKTDGRLGGSGG